MTDPDGVLPCGHSAADAWDGDGRPGCVHCAAVVEQRAALTLATAAYVDEWAAPGARSARASLDLVDRVMRRVATEIRPAVRLRIGDAYVTDVAIGNALRLVLDGDPAVVARRCRVEASGAGLYVWLSVAVSFEHYDRHGDEVVRSRVVAAVDELFDARVENIDIDVVDVFASRRTIGA